MKTAWDGGGMDDRSRNGPQRPTHEGDSDRLRHERRTDQVAHRHVRFWPVRRFFVLSADAGAPVLLGPAIHPAVRRGDPDVAGISNQGVSSMGKKQEFTVKDGVLTKYKGPVGDVAVPDGVTVIGDGVFMGRTGLTRVTVPEGVTEIGVGAFYGCTGLTGIAIPGSVAVICDWSFSSCTGLTRVDIPEDAAVIGDRAFAGCTGLTRVTVPGRCTEIGASAFANCRKLVIHAPSGSPAELYARKNGIRFVSMGRTGTSGTA